MNDGLYAKIKTGKGDILLQLEYEKTPGTVGNFVALSEGDLENSARPQGKKYYDGLKFQVCDRVVKRVETVAQHFTRVPVDDQD